jgi:hypothetical protein
MGLGINQSVRPDRNVSYLLFSTGESHCQQVSRVVRLRPVAENQKTLGNAYHGPHFAATFVKEVT